MILAIFTVTIVIFAPKKFENFASLKNIEKITYTNIHNRDSVTDEILVYELSNDERKLFIEQIKNTKYKRRIGKIKKINTWRYKIYYTNGKFVVLGDITMSKYDKKGKMTFCMQYIFYSENGITKLGNYS